MCGAEEFAAASCARTRQPYGAAQAERYDGDAERRHGFGSTGNLACAASSQRRCVENARKRWRRWFDVEYERNDVARRACLARSCCGDSLAQAGLPVLLNGVKGLTSKEVSYMRLTQHLDCDT
jgi:hypothetical protein